MTLQSDPVDSPTRLSMDRWIVERYRQPAARAAATAKSPAPAPKLETPQTVRLERMAALPWRRMKTAGVGCPSQASS
jgi:hypothetical protein